jgi:hypothetical protein
MTTKRQDTSKLIPVDVPAGLSTKAGLLVTVLGLAAAVYAAIQENDTATVASGAAGILALLGTMGGRYAQSIAVIRAAAVVANPWIDAAQAAITGVPALAVTAQPDNPMGDIDNSLLAPVDGDVDERTDGDPVDETRSVPEKE